jgi:hypothetical protein
MLVPPAALPAITSFLGEFWIRFDFADLKDVALLMGGDQQQPLISVAPLPFHVMAAEIVVGRLCVFQHLCMQPA